jgi:hypothetical protein
MKTNEARSENVSSLLANYMASQKDAIIKEWAAQVRKDAAVPTDNMAALAIVEHVPPIFDAIVHALRKHRTDITMEQIRQSTATHIITRWQQNYSLPAVLREVSLLRTVFIYHLRLFEELHPDFVLAERFFASATINSMLDEVGMDATDQFLKLTRDNPRSKQERPRRASPGKAMGLAKGARRKAR